MRGKVYGVAWKGKIKVIIGSRGRWPFCSFYLFLISEKPFACEGQQ